METAATGSRAGLSMPTPGHWGTLVNLPCKGQVSLVEICLTIMCHIATIGHMRTVARRSPDR
jgi:hypothetical protein